MTSRPTILATGTTNREGQAKSFSLPSRRSLPPRPKLCFTVLSDEHPLPNVRPVLPLPYLVLLSEAIEVTKH